ncbi:MAG TPA: acyltransferase [Patescibacteria group bacterium]|nr:acyltransferase [Patescibacteria group bacterium]
MNSRNQTIDNLRGFSLIVMILTHATGYFPSGTLSFPIWNWSNFSVQIFVFCSVYLFIKKYEDKAMQVITFLKKRFIRLLIPYYLFLIFFLPAIYFAEPWKVTPRYIKYSLAVIGGVDINWLVLLFLSLTIVLPIFLWSYRKVKVIFWMFFICAFGSSVYLLFQDVNIPYKWIMWLPWSLLLFFTLFYVKFEEKKRILFGGFLFSLVIFVVSYMYTFMTYGESTVFFHNKYPPNIYYLSYGIVVFFLLLFFEKYLFRQSFIQRTVTFFSTHSYSIYFIHYTILIVAAVYIQQFHLTWWSLFLIVFILSWVTQSLFNFIRKKFALLTKWT